MDYKDKTIEAYDKNAKDLSEKFKRLMNVGERSEFKKFVELLNGKNILDLGCGSGDHSLYFKEMGLDVTSIDLSEEMIGLCKKKGLDASIMDIEDLNFEAESFDGVWAATSLLHIPKLNLKNVIQKISLILKNEGVFYVCVKEGKGEGMVQDVSGNTSRFFAYWEEEEIKKMFEGSFLFIGNERVQLDNRIFLKMFFKKRL